MSEKLRVTVWNEYVPEIKDPEAAAVYPDGIHKVIADALNKNAGITARTATLAEPEHGLTQEVLDDTDVLLWWGHCAHDKVEDAIVERVWARVLAGMGLIVLHSGHASKIFHKLLGTATHNLKWREVGELERVWVINPAHPIASGIHEFIEIPHTEMYGEVFEIPAPDEIVFLSWYEGGEVFRSGITFNRGLGKIFYFSPGHETYPIYHQAEVQRVIENAVLWAKPPVGVKMVTQHYPGVQQYKDGLKT
jgi:trehalose utilization protein